MTTLEQRAASWMDHANCRDADPDLFYINRTDLGWTSDASEAKTICASCTVRRACLEYAMTHHEIHGIWGGTTPRERRTLRRQRQLGMRT